MRGYELTDLTVSGMWVDFGVSEDVIMSVAWRHERDTIKVIEVSNCYGSYSGTNYTDILHPCPDLMNHLRDMIIERYEV